MPDLRRHEKDCEIANWFDDGLEEQYVHAHRKKCIDIMHETVATKGKLLFGLENNMHTLRHVIKQICIARRYL